MKDLHHNYSPTMADVDTGANEGGGEGYHAEFMAWFKSWTKRRGRTCEESLRDLRDKLYDVMQGMPEAWDKNRVFATIEGLCVDDAVCVCHVSTCPRYEHGKRVLRACGFGSCAATWSGFLCLLKKQTFANAIAARFPDVSPEEVDLVRTVLLRDDFRGFRPRKRSRRQLRLSPLAAREEAAGEGMCFCGNDCPGFEAAAAAAAFGRSGFGTCARFWVMANWDRLERAAAGQVERWEVVERRVRKICPWLDPEDALTLARIVADWEPDEGEFVPCICGRGCLDLRYRPLHAPDAVVDADGSIILLPPPEKRGRHA